MLPIKRIHWSRSSKNELVQNEYHSVFSLGSEPVKVELKEPIRITIGNVNEEPEHFGIAEVVSIKRCCIGDLDNQDLARQKQGYKTRRDTVRSLRALYKEDINFGTEVVVVTLRRHDYNLKKLNSMVKTNVKKMGKKP